MALQSDYDAPEVVFLSCFFSSKFYLEILYMHTFGVIPFSMLLKLFEFFYEKFKYWISEMYEVQFKIRVRGAEKNIVMFVPMSRWYIQEICCLVQFMINVNLRIIWILFSTHQQIFPGRNNFKISPKCDSGNEGESFASKAKKVSSFPTKASESA